MWNGVRCGLLLCNDVKHVVLWDVVAVCKNMVVRGEMCCNIKCLGDVAWKWWCDVEWCDVKGGVVWNVAGTHTNETSVKSSGVMEWCVMWKCYVMWNAAGTHTNETSGTQLHAHAKRSESRGETLGLEGRFKWCYGSRVSETVTVTVLPAQVQA